VAARKETYVDASMSFSPPRAEVWGGENESFMIQTYKDLTMVSQVAIHSQLCGQSIISHLLLRYNASTTLFPRWSHGCLSTTSGE
jgi:hypothetical protein